MMKCAFFVAIVAVAESYQQLKNRGALPLRSHVLRHALPAGTALITGASSGIGLASAKALARAGCKSMVLTARRADRLEALSNELRSSHPGIEIHAAVLDVTDLKAVIRFPDELPGPFRRISLLLNNAGLAAGFGPVSTYNLDDMEVISIAAP